MQIGLCRERNDQASLHASSAADRATAGVWGRRGGEPMTTNGDFWGLMGTKIHGDSRSNR